MEYTEKIHAEGLLEIFTTAEPCTRCPKNMVEYIYRVELERGAGCEICWGFILKPFEKQWALCPCYRWNEDKAAKRTWLALEEKGYI